MANVKLIFTPSGPGHVFKAYIGSGYVEVDDPGLIKVTKQQAKILTVDYPANFSWPVEEKAAEPPASDRSMPAPGENRSQEGTGGDG